MSYVTTIAASLLQCSEKLPIMLNIMHKDKKCAQSVMLLYTSLHEYITSVHKVENFRKNALLDCINL